MNVILFDNKCRLHLLPLTYMRPIADLRVGILTIREKWERLLQHTTYSLTNTYLQEKYPLQTEQRNLLIAGSLLPNEELLTAITNLQVGEALYDENTLLAFCTDDVANLRNFYDVYLQNETAPLPFIHKPFHGAYAFIERPYHLFLWNEIEIARDFTLLTAGRKSQPLSATNTIIGDPSHIFIEEGASVECATFNPQQGYIYIGKGAEVMEGTYFRGSTAICEYAVTKLGTKIYGATTIGPFCKVGGELSNVVFLGYSNKGHDGFLGNAVIAEWCNLGAATNCSNLKNNYSTVRLWDYATHKMEDTGLQFCGLIMGDHSKCGINTMFNTGTVVGVCCCLFDGGFHPKYVPSFSFGRPSAVYDLYDPEKIINTAQKVMARRHKNLDTIEQNLIRKVYSITTINEK